MAQRTTLDKYGYILPEFRVAVHDNNGYVSNDGGLLGYADLNPSDGQMLLTLTGLQMIIALVCGGLYILRGSNGYFMLQDAEKKIFAKAKP